MNKSVLKLFKAVQVPNRFVIKSIDETLLRKTLKHGFIISPEVPITNEILNLIIDEYGLSGEQMNRAFHKSWSKVANAPIEQLLLEQMFHYVTTYGFESIGVYDKDLVYIPEEELNIPDMDIGKIPLIVIKGITTDKIKEKVMDMLQSGIALKEDTIDCIMDIIKNIHFSFDGELDTIKNKEVLCRVCSLMDRVPKNPTEFVRYLVYKTTGNTLLIKSKEVIEDVKTHASEISSTMMYDCGLESLATVFNRFKPIFLALRKNYELKPSINKIRKLAKKHHKPIPEDLLNNITAKLNKKESISKSEFLDELDKVNVFRKIRLAYALKYRTADVSSILYKIRNGKGYAKDFNFTMKKQANEICEYVLDSIINDIRPNVENKIFYIPKNVSYTLPATEKQFTGNLPSGSSVSIDKNMIFGIHWNNVGDYRVDLDLALISKDGKMGWDGSYRDEGILFSGDITDAPKEKGGASELFFINKRVPGKYLLTVNYYNYDKDIPVPFKVMVAYDKNVIKHDIDVRKYMVDPNNVIMSTNTFIDKQQKVIGMVTITEDKCIFNFVESNVGTFISSRETETMKHIRNYIFDSNTNGIDLKYVLEKAGAIVIDNISFDLEVSEEEEDGYIDLSPEVVERDTFINLLT